MKEQDANLKLSKDNFLPQKRDCNSSSDLFKRIIKSDSSNSNSDSDSNGDSDSNSDSDSEINEIGDEDYSFLINF